MTQKARALRVLVGFVRTTIGAQLQNIAFDSGVERSALNRFLRADHQTLKQSDFDNLMRYALDKVANWDGAGSYHQYIEAAIIELQGGGAAPRPLTPEELDDAFCANLRVDQDVLSSGRLIRKAAGPWDVLRFSSQDMGKSPDLPADISAVPSLNLAFLNIHPSSDGKLPRFQVKVRSDHGGTSTNQTFEGPILATNDWIYFVGNMRTNARMFLMVWQFPEGEHGDDMPQRARGLIITQNTDRIPIAAPVWARRIGQKNLEDKKEYETLKDGRIKDLGTIPNDLRDQLMTLEELNEFLKRHWALVYKATG